MSDKGNFDTVLKMLPVVTIIVTIIVAYGLFNYQRSLEIKSVAMAIDEDLEYTFDSTQFQVFYNSDNDKYNAYHPHPDSTYPYLPIYAETGIRESFMDDISKINNYTLAADIYEIYNKLSIIEYKRKFVEKYINETQILNITGTINKPIFGKEYNDNISISIKSAKENSYIIRLKNEAYTDTQKLIKECGNKIQIVRPQLKKIYEK